MRNIFYLALSFTLLMLSCSSSGKKTVSREASFNIKSKYLLVPVEKTAPEVALQLSVDGNNIGVPVNIRIAKEKTDNWVPVEVGQYNGKTIVLSMTNAEQEPANLSRIKQSDSFEYNFNEKYRPQYHFSPQYGWTNDPNGMVYHNGEYHLCFQHNPYGTTWGNMNWGHAVSKDLKKWEYLPIAIAPDTLGTIFSGSTVVDKNNTAGFGENALVAIYTSDGVKQTQSIAYSNDNGLTFAKYDKNPVLTSNEYKDFRDPKVFWHEESKQWVMSLATTQVITFYGSKNLKEWEKLSDFGNGIGNHDGVWECPDLFPLSYNGQLKWVLLVSINPGGPNGGSATQYFIGQFDGKEFIADKLPYPLWIDYGRDNYAGITWSNTPDKRAVFIGWMSNWDYANQVPSINFSNAMTLPRELSIANNGKHLVVASNPVQEIESLRAETNRLEDISTDKEFVIEKLLSANTGAYELEMDVDASGSSTFSLKLQNKEKEELSFNFDLTNEVLTVDRSKSGIIDLNDKFASSVSKAPLAKKNKYKIRLFIDNASSEIFVNDGVIVQTNIIFPNEPFNTLTITNKGKQLKVSNIKAHLLK